MTQTRFPLTELRYWSFTVEHPGELERQLELFAACPDAFDEVWLGTLSGLPLLAAHAGYAEKCAAAAARFRAAGVGVSLQVTESFGHWGYGAASYAAWDNWRGMIGLDGQSNSNVACPGDPGFLKYEAEAVKLYAAAIRPATIWYDDDLRLGNHGKIRFGCFCDTCLSEFSARTGREWSRAELAAELQRPQSGIRLAWQEFNQFRLARFARIMAEAVHRVAPECRLALQNCTLACTYNGNNFNPVLHEFAAATGRPAGVRPGGGAYVEFAPGELLNKAFYLGVTALSAFDGGEADLAAAEVENYPHNTLGKSAYATAFEGALDLAAGCNALSFVLGPQPSKDFAEELRYFTEIAAFRPLYEVLSRHIRAGARPGGLNFSRDLRHTANVGEAGMGWSWFSPDEAIELTQTGLPVVWRDSDFGKAPALLTASAAAGLERHTFDELLQCGLMLGGEAFDILQRRGFTAGLGITSKQIPDEIFFYERFSDDPANGADAEARYSFPVSFGASYALDVANPAARILAYACRRSNHERLGVSALMLELPGGGRLALAAVPGRFNRQITAAKQRQLMKMADFVTGGTLPVIPEAGALVWPVPLVMPGGVLAAVTVVNPSIAPLDPLRLRLRGVPAGSRARFYRNGCAVCDLALQATPGGETETVCPALPGWALGVISLEGGRD